MKRLVYLAFGLSWLGMALMLLNGVNVPDEIERIVARWNIPELVLIDRDAINRAIENACPSRSPYRAQTDTQTIERFHCRMNEEKRRERFIALSRY
jgi:hypothetical protein